MSEIKRYIGTSGSARSWLVANSHSSDRVSLIICEDSKEISKVASELEFFLGNQVSIYQFLPWDTLPFETVSPSTEILSERIKTLWFLLENKSGIIITSSDALIQKVISAETLKALSIKIKKRLQIDRQVLMETCLNAGFKSVSLVEEVGDVSIRGNVIDVFSPNYNSPLRIEFFANAIDSIRFFDPETQRSIEDLDSAQVIPIREFSGYIVPDTQESNLESYLDRLRNLAKNLEVPPSESEKFLSAIKERIALPGIEQFLGVVYSSAKTLFDYLPTNSRAVVLDEISVSNAHDRFQEIISERYNRLALEHRFIPNIDSLYLSQAQTNERLKIYDQVIFDRVSAISANQDSIEPIRVTSLTNLDLSTKLKSKAGSGKAFEHLIQKIDSWQKEGIKVAFVVGSDSRAKRLERILLDNDVISINSKNPGVIWAKNPESPNIVVLKGRLDEGFQLPDQKIVFISEVELFADKSYARVASKTKSVKKFLSALAQLKDEDFIVHIDYGVGLYHGLVHKVVDRMGRDFLHIEYAGGTKLFLPVENIGKIQKFVSKEGQKPVLDKLGSQKWASKKAKVKQALVSLAGELIKLYATRKTLRGWRFEPYGAEDERFEDGFAYEETPDQLRAIQETLADMASEQPMDRLVCGDAGFGKTEVALRAAYKCVQHGRQVAVLVPTTILAEQHYEVFRKRFLEYPVKVGAFSRFYKSKDNELTLAGLASGDIDIVIGTHKLLQANVEIKDLGLLIIDEEHRFGVKHKERLKQLKKNVDVLTLTATPIPRTLHMALLGIREISIITTPPHDRRVIRTYAATYDEHTIRDAVLREIQRKGQCFILHNKVQNIQTVTKQFAELIPEARFDFAHGQMKNAELEKKMLRFVKQDIDVLVCTTIIESGLDIPNANTIILTRADQLGLAQLYQLRGRVGRSNKQAYAYLLVPEFKKLGDDARKRLQVLQSLDDLGLGFNLAARDLEIRGAGNLLGKDQSGNVQTVGLDLYNRILKEAILNLRGEELELAETIDPELRISVDAYIPANYIPDISERLILYQRLADLDNNQSSLDLYYEIEDRFGHMPKSVSNLIELMRLRALLKLCGVVRIEASADIIALTFSAKAKIDLQKFANLKLSDPESFTSKSKLTFCIKISSETIDNPGDIFNPSLKFLQSTLNPFPGW